MLRISVCTLTACQFLSNSGQIQICRSYGSCTSQACAAPACPVMRRQLGDQRFGDCQCCQTKDLELSSAQTRDLSTSSLTRLDTWWLSVWPDQRSCDYQCDQTRDLVTTSVTRPKIVWLPVTRPEIVWLPVWPDQRSCDYQCDQTRARVTTRNYNNVFFAYSKCWFVPGTSASDFNGRPGGTTW